MLQMDYTSRATAMVVFILLTQPVLVCGSAMNGHSLEQAVTSLDLVLDAVSWGAYQVVGQRDQAIRGRFTVSTDGSLYLGDEQKYDNWAPIKIDFFILSEENYSLFIGNEAVSASFIIEDASAGSWEFKIPSAGTWYLIYRNPTIYMVSVQSRFAMENAGSIPLLVVVGAASALIVAALLILYRRH